MIRRPPNSTRTDTPFPYATPSQSTLVAALIRGRKVEDAMNVLAFSKKAMAVDVRKVLASAVANAENNHNLDVDALVIQEASVGKSISMKRWHARGRGK